MAKVGTPFTVNTCTAQNDVLETFCRGQKGRGVALRTFQCCILITARLPRLSLAELSRAGSNQLEMGFMNETDVA